MNKEQQEIKNHFATGEVPCSWVYETEVCQVIGHLSHKEQCEITERAVVLLGNKLTDKTYLETLKGLL